MAVFQGQFAAQTLIASQEELRRLFHSDSLYLAEGARLTLEGEITLGPDVAFHGECQLSGPCEIQNGAILTNVALGRANRVRAYSVISDLVAGDRNLFGPFCFIRNNCTVGDDCILGAHVEAARSVFASGVKISHRAFVGDARIGRDVIIGAGVVFCNFDSAGARQPTLIGDGVIVGSGSLLVAPVTLGNRAVIAAGSTVTKDVAVGAKLIQKR